MPADLYNVAIDMAGRQGSITLGRGDEMIATHDLPDTRKPPRHRIALIPAIDQLLGEQAVRPQQLDQVYLSIGPGSFTGLRIAVTTAKTLAQALNVRLVAVPTLDVIVHGQTHGSPTETPPPHLAVCLNVKGDTCYTGLYQRQEATWIATQPPAVMSWDQVMSTAPRPLAILADQWPNEFAQQTPAGVTWLGRPPLTRGSESVWQLGRHAARKQQFTDPTTLLPLYVRPPEAEVLWRQRQAGSAPGRSPQHAGGAPKLAKNG